ncbi:hypothetical protein [Pseudomonas sp. PDM31]|uniref:hypothetical protein n=1 Tax=Pseudomonas sp. PDM31 TaxID=2854778 RepID=UPI001C46D780|nr:hypothetical protein [Pseudomonas sp. PDM31]MBV7477184.1 hypothetical protein [Pseudomonas sp. PDM31]
MTPEELNRINAEHFAKRQKKFAEQCENHPEQLVVAARRATKLVLAGHCGDADFLEDTSIEAVMGAESRRQAEVASKQRKKKEKTTLSGEFIKRMTLARRDVMTFPEFIESALMGSIDGITLSVHESGRYCVDADAVLRPEGAPQEPEKKSKETLKGWWKEAGKII